MAKRGPKPRENTLTTRVQFRISADTMAAFEDCAEVLDVPAHHLMRQALDESAGFMVTMSAALRQMKGEDPIKGLDLYRQILSSFGPQIEVQQGVIDSWDDRLREHQATAAAASSEASSEGGTV
jgi:hypothetical protein